MASVKVWLENREPVLLLLNTTVELPLPLSFISSRPTGYFSSSFLYVRRPWGSCHPLECVGVPLFRAPDIVLGADINFG